MLKTFLSFLWLITFSAKAFSADTAFYKQPHESLTVLKQHVITDILATPVKEGEVMGFAKTLKADGSWADIDYTDKTRGGWPVNDHLVRLNNMAVLYKRAGSKFRGNAELEGKILSGLNFWLKNDFICPNWWYPEIGVPKVLGPTMLLMEDKLTTAQRESGIKILNRAKIGMTGQNKVWLSGNVIYRSLLTGDAKLIDSAVKAIQEEVVISEGEGIQPDYSFHQHGTQQQFGNYGAAFAVDMLKWAVIFQNTSYQFEAKKMDILRNYLLKGMRWILWHHNMDISACGRQLFPNAQAGKAKSMETVFAKMPLADPPFKAQYLSAMNDFEGNFHFWRSDMTVHRRACFYTSVKMSSKRVGGAESCNSENVQGYHLGDGATYFYGSGEEYTDIFPFWDWKLIPGTTTFHDAEPLPVLPCSGYNINSDFVGGVSDGTNGAATLAYHRDGLHAQKSWFFFNDAIICLGAGISSGENKEVTTAVNQSLLHGKVWIKQAAAAQVTEAGQRQLSGVSWVLHDNWGYYFPGKANIEMANQTQSGDWNRVMKSMPSKEIKADLFTLWFNHGAKPAGARYAYYVFPAATAGNIEPRAAAIDIIENSDRLQAVENRAAGMAGFVFVQPGEAATKIFGKVSADTPCVLLMTKRSGGSAISVSDPTHLQTRITLGLPGNKKSKTVAGKYDSAKNVTFFTVHLPQGGEAGKSISLTVE